jgi:predicted O-methyltransferase YrrM
MKNLLLIFFISFITVFVANAQSGKLKKANGYYELLSYSLAIKSYTELLNTDLANAEMKSKLAHSYFNVNDFLNAENTKNNTYDFIYIDADHVASSVLSDAELSWPLLKAGGIMSFDDYSWGDEKPAHLRPRTAILSFVEKYKNQIETMAMNHQYWIKKI